MSLLSLLDEHFQLLCLPIPMDKCIRQHFGFCGWIPQWIQFCIHLFNHDFVRLIEDSSYEWHDDETDCSLWFSKFNVVNEMFHSVNKVSLMKFFNEIKTAIFAQICDWNGTDANDRWDSATLVFIKDRSWSWHCRTREENEVFSLTPNIASAIDKCIKWKFQNVVDNHMIETSYNR